MSKKKELDRISGFAGFTGLILVNSKKENPVHLVNPVKEKESRQDFRIRRIYRIDFG
ncbi:MAG: hypothetical protein IPQ05_05895 [Leptospiraceae bacterium]|nr:hypothetical protein [Leptospiraceae bacterium]MBK9501687.1 hypothetical protein [Leptospiraceae bacterium]MBL0263406.1 hypothetical protein [Leptospiraceae bacterium]